MSQKRKRKYTKAGMLQILRIAITLLVFSTVIALIVARFVQAAVNINPSNPFGALLVSPSVILDNIKDKPLYINFENSTVKTAALIGFVIPFLLGMSTLSKAWKGYFDTGAEHGDDRLADKKETAKFLDKRHYYNNMLHSKNSGVMIQPYNRRLRQEMRGIHPNTMNIGISGRGKTFSLVKPTVMQSVGCALPYEKPSFAQVMLNASQQKPEARFAYEKYINKKHQKVVAEAKRLGIGDGFDLFLTDPKGDTLRDCGHLLEAAGTEIRVLNTIDVSESDKFNPLAYIPAYEIDCVTPADQEIKLSSYSEGQLEFSQQIALSDANETEEIKSLSFKDIQANLTYKIISQTQKSEFSSEDKEETNEAITEVVDNFYYTRSEIKFALMVKNTSKYAEKTCLEITLPNSFSLANVDKYSSADSVECSLKATRKSLTLDVDYMPSQGEDELAYVSVEFTVQVIPMTVPDGVMLTKVARTLVDNLKGSDQPSTNEDPFWPEVKMLAFMWAISHVFEHYDKKYWNLPTVVDLFDYILPEEGSVTSKSIMDVITEYWETGKRLVPTETTSQGRRQVISTKYDESGVPHSRRNSYSIHLYHAFRHSAEDTVRSVVVTCHTAFVRLLSPQMRSLLEKDELELDRLGEPDRRRAIFLISSDTDNTYQFLSALAVTLAIDLNMEKAYKKYGGRFPRHVRFELDELYALGYIPVIKHAITVVRSRNASMSMYVQSLKSIEELYKEAGVETLVDNCPTLLFLGTQNKETLEMFSQRTGEETVYARTIQRNFGDFGVQGTNESISGTGRKVKSVTQLALMDFDHIMSFVMGKYPIYDLKFDTPSHPLYSWIDPTEKRKFDQPQPHFSERFDYKKYKQRRDGKEKK